MTATPQARHLTSDGPEPTPTPAVPAAPTGLEGQGPSSLQALASATLSWDAAPGADITGYQYRQKDATANGDWGQWTAIPESGAGASSYEVNGLTNGSEYHFRLRAVNTAGAGPPRQPATPTTFPSWLAWPKPPTPPTTTRHRPAWDDGLIEISSLAQLNGQATGRRDLDGDGSSTNSGYATSFPSALADMGCPKTGCIGYELKANLDFDTAFVRTGGDGTADSEDTYRNGGAGWDPIDQFAATFRIYQARGQQRHRQQPRICQ